MVAVMLAEVLVLAKEWEDVGEERDEDVLEDETGGWIWIPASVYGS